MIRKLALICILGFVPVIGCSESKPQIDSSKVQRIDTPSGMMEYLHGQKLPVLESVEIWQNEYGHGLRLTTAHYEILTTLLEPLMLSQLPGFVESAYRGYNSQLPKPIETTTRFTIYLFAERKQWEDFTNSFAGPQAPLYCKIKSGAYYLNGACVAYNIGRERTFSAIGHEGWHQFNKMHFKFRFPSWIDEGIAMLFETSRHEQGLFYFEPVQNMNRLATLKLTLMKNKMIPLKELIAMNPGEALVTSDDIVMAFYSQAYALVRFLREDGLGKRLGDYHQLLEDGLEGRWPLEEKAREIAADRNIPLTVWWNRAVGTKLFEYYVSGNFDQIEKEYLTFCRKIVYNVHLQN
ncbi:MAG: hypothetical protein WAK60_00590 [Sedimentisphaerales bacterium]